MNNKFQRLGNKILTGIGFKEKKKKSKPEAWASDAHFQELYKEIKGKTLVTADRCFAIYQLVQYAAALEGEMAEVGVYKGGTARMIGKTAAHKAVHLFDTFSGMPAVNKEIDLHREGEFNDTSLEGVKSFLNNLSNVHYYPGFFPRTADPVKNKSFCFVHSDVDIYQSVKDCLEFFYPRLVKGGIVVFDDYKWKDTPGVERALDEFLSDKPEKLIISALYQCFFIKLH